MGPKTSRDSPIKIPTLVVTNLSQNELVIFTTIIFHLPTGFCPMMVAASLTPWLRKNSKALEDKLLAPVVGGIERSDLFNITHATLNSIGSLGFGIE
jgi:hypothetical protein